MQEWTHIKTIQQFPALLQQGMSPQFLFSPNFDHYLDIDFIAKIFFIKTLDFKGDDDNDKMVIPRDMLNIELFS